jgi:hypothetical protein
MDTMAERAPGRETRLVFGGHPFRDATFSGGTAQKSCCGCGQHLTRTNESAVVKLAAIGVRESACPVSACG